MANTMERAASAPTPNPLAAWFLRHAADPRARQRLLSVAAGSAESLANRWCCATASEGWLPTMAKQVAIRDWTRSIDPEDFVQLVHWVPLAEVRARARAERDAAAEGLP